MNIQAAYMPATLVSKALSEMILSHSGWRGVFAADGGGADGEESRTGDIGTAHRLIVAGAALTFAEYLRSIGTDKGYKPFGSSLARPCPCKHGRGLAPFVNKPVVLVGTDTRPTGPAIAEAVIRVLAASGCRVLYSGVTAAPEIMARARSLEKQPAVTGFIYISASHNPIGHNGLKFGLADGGVLPAEETAKLTAAFRSLMEKTDTPARLESLMAGVDPQPRPKVEGSPLDPAVLREIFAAEPEVKKETLAAYSGFCEEVVFGGTTNYQLPTTNYRLGICCDFNGSARCVSIDRVFFGGLGIQFEAINDQPGEIAHRIVPEGESLEPCRLFLEETHRRNPAFVLGYVPDCDGDRGNLVIWDDHLQKARALEAQEVFALACVAELAQLTMNNEQLTMNNEKRTSLPHCSLLTAHCSLPTAHYKLPTNHAIAVNDPTSLRVDRIAEAFGVSVFRAEVGEANVVGLARKLRENGYTVRILGEGSAGGNITHPSAVRDPLHTVMALAKLLSVRTTGSGPGLFEIWCRTSSQTQLYRPDFNLADIIASLPPFATTAAYAPEAALKVTTADHGVLKSRYQRVFLREWERRKNELKSSYGICGWTAAAYNGIEERKGIADFGEAGKGGLKICFENADGKAVASIWMRGSATENIFRVMADAGSAPEGAASSAEGDGRQCERDLIEWQRKMTIEAEGENHGITG